MAPATGNSDEESLKTGLAKASQWCASEEQCLWDVQRKLTRLGYSASGISHILQRLAAEDFVNEKRYALAFARGKFNLFKWGKNKIAAALRMKRIPEPFIRIALERIDPEVYLECLNTLLHKKKRELGNETPLVMKQKLLRFALQKGYEAELVFTLLQMTDE
jgi:regulatory protein